MGDEGEKFYDDEEEELAAATPNQRNWKGIIIAVLVICFVLGMIVTSVLLLTPPDDGPRVKGRRFELDDILGDDFKIHTFNGSWISDNTLVYRDTAGGLSIFNAETLTTEVLVSNITFRQLNVAHFSVSPDLKYVLMAEHVEKLFRYSFKARYHIFVIKTQHHFPLTPTPDGRGHPSLILAKWAPVGSGIVMVDDHCNILYKKTATEQAVHRITDTGVPGVVFNGIPDWVYEEEILNSNSALWFSPDGGLLAYATINDTLVDTVPILEYGPEKQYSETRSLKYPKPGQENPKVTLWVVNLGDINNLKRRDLKPPNVVKDQNHYFTAVTWIDITTVSVIWMNRAQNTSVITSCSHPMYFCQSTHTEHSSHGWVDLYDPPIYSADKQSYLVRLPVRDGDEGEFKHVNQYSVRMRRVVPITHGAFEVTKILGWDQNSNYIYYMATVEDKPGDRHLYRVPDVTSPMLRIPECLSCLEADNTTDTCLYNNAHLSPDYSFFILECLGPDVPRTYLFSTWSGQMIYSLDDYNELRDRVAEMAMPRVQTFNVELEGDKTYTYHVQLFLPPGLREDEITQYPMVVHTYAAPGAQAVTSKMTINWGTFLASKNDIIYALIDGRGSGFQGNKIKHEIYHALGGKEVDDQLAVAKYLRDNLHFVDEKRIAIWGWSYGGYVTTMAMARDADKVFSCGIAVAPVSRWEHYDSVYTERYMGYPDILPGSNYKGYEAADATKMAGNLKDKMFLLIHGTADDNVHYHHSMMLAKALVDEGVQFQQMTYADENHGLTGVQEHLYRTMGKFLAECHRPSLKELYVLIKKRKKDLEEIVGYL